MKTYKNDIALEYCKKYNDFSTMAITRLLIRDYPIEFTETNTRAMVRHIRNELANRQGILEKRSPTQMKQFMTKKFDLPTSDYQAPKPFKIPKAQNNILLLSDIHFPYQDNDALELALNYGLEHNINAIYLNGDTLDMYHCSRFIKDIRNRDLAGELQMCRDFFKILKDRFNLPIYFKIGNHEKRWQDFLRLQAPELLGIPDFRLDVILRFKEFGVTLIQDRQIAMAGKLPILHGHEWHGGFAPPVNPARGLFLKAKQSCIIGHHHRTSEHTEKSLRGEVTTTWSTGCLCGLQPDYAPYNNYNHGFAHITTDPNGSYQVKNIRIIDYKIV
jgi:predicted phosphodiesterase